MVAIVEFKWHMASICILGIVIYKFRYWQESCLIILLPVDKSLEVNLYYIVVSFYLSISLKVESLEKLPFNP